MLFLSWQLWGFFIFALNESGKNLYSRLRKAPGRTLEGPAVTKMQSAINAGMGVGTIGEVTTSKKTRKSTSEQRNIVQLKTIRSFLSCSRRLLGEHLILSCSVFFLINLLHWSAIRLNLSNLIILRIWND